MTKYSYEQWNPSLAVMKLSPWCYSLLKHLVSSTNNRDFDTVVTESKSFISIRNKTGPRMLPWGTPGRTDKVVDKTLLILTT